MCKNWCSFTRRKYTEFFFGVLSRENDRSKFPIFVFSKVYCFKVSCTTISINMLTLRNLYAKIQADSALDVG